MRASASLGRRYTRDSTYHVPTQRERPTAPHAPPLFTDLLLQILHSNPDLPTLDNLAALTAEGIPVILLKGLWLGEVVYRDLKTRSEVWTIAGMPCRSLCLEDHLLYLCFHAAIHHQFVYVGPRALLDVAVLIANPISRAAVATQFATTTNAPGFYWLYFKRWGHLLKEHFQNFVLLSTGDRVRRAELRRMQLISRWIKG